ncbi:MAG: hypothetical protein RLZ04_909 [Actinomycetota bacterium]
MSRVRSFVAASVLLGSTGLAGACSSSSSTGTSATVASTSPSTTAPSVESTVPETSSVETTPATESVPVETVAGIEIWDEIGPPNSPTEHTDEVPDGSLVDGFYWANLVGGSAAAPYVTVMQAFFGAECPTAAAEDGEECYGDVYVRANPTLDVDDVLFAADALITVVDPNVMQNYRIDATELDVLRTEGVSGSAPEGFLFVPFPWLMTVQGGEIVAFQQLWVP